MSTSQNKKRASIEYKFEALQEIESGQPKSLVAQKYGVPSIVYKFGVLKYFGSKIVQGKLIKFWTMVSLSCIILCTKMFQYSHYLYCSQEESKYFCLRVLTHFCLEVTAQFFGGKNHTRKR